MNGEQARAIDGALQVLLSSVIATRAEMQSLLELIGNGSEMPLDKAREYIARPLLVACRSVRESGNGGPAIDHIEREMTEYVAGNRSQRPPTLRIVRDDEEE